MAATSESKSDQTSNILPTGPAKVTNQLSTQLQEAGMAERLRLSTSG